MARSKYVLSSKKIEKLRQDAKAIKYWRRHPVQACRDLLGIQLIDSQKYLLVHMWNTPNVCITASRNFGKSFLSVIYLMLRFILYPNQEIYIISSVGAQAQEAFMKMEKISKGQLDSIDVQEEIRKIFLSELVKPANGDGFNHDKASFKVESFGGSKIYTLNSKPDNVRSRRAAIVFFDESAFCSDELINAALPFLTQNSGFKTSINKDFDSGAEAQKIPNQVVYASSAGDVEGHHYKAYVEFAMKMIAGDSRYFCADIPCDIPLNPFMDGEPMDEPLLTQEKIDSDMRTNPDKAKREYYNQFDTDGGETQVIKRSQILRNESFLLPKLENDDPEGRFVFAIDPARTSDNSVSGVMQILKDPEKGFYGEISNCVNFVEFGKKSNRPMLTPDQIDYAKHMMLNYCSDDAPYGIYKNIDALMLDQGSGGGGVSAWADGLLKDWTDNKGRKQRGFIDADHEYFQEYRRDFPRAVDKLHLISPQKYKNQMVQELVELMELDLIKFPRAFDGKDYITEIIQKGKEEILNEVVLSMEEKVALVNIDAMKSETLSIHRFKSPSGSLTYKLPKEKERTHHDDRFYVLLLLAHRLYEIRKEEELKNSRQSKIPASAYNFW